MTLLGGAAVPPDRLGVIVCDAFAGVVLHPEGVLRLGGASLGEGVQVGKFLC